MTLYECGAPTPGYLGLQILRTHTHTCTHKKRKKTIINAKTATGPENPIQTEQQWATLQRLEARFGR